MNESMYISTLLGIEVVFSIMVLVTLRNAGLKTVPMLMLGIVFAVWLTSVYELLMNGFFEATGRPQLSFTLGVVTPTIVGLLAVYFWKPLKAAVDAMPTSSFLRLQTMRAVFGVMFFFTTSLPVWFQYVGGLGDIAAGVGAFLAMRHYQTHPDEESRAILRGNLIGILDFLVVLNLGVFVVLQDHSPDISFNLIPLFAVPIFILLHLFSLQKLRQTDSNVQCAASELV